MLPSGQPAPVNREPTQTLRTLALARRLLAKALTQPVNVLVPALVAVFGVVFAPWLFLVAALSYVALVVITYFDEAEAHRAAEARRSGGRLVAVSRVVRQSPHSPRSTTSWASTL